MRELLVLQGGYQRVMDRVLDLQTEMLTMGNAQFSALGVDLVLSGCAVTDNHNGTINIAPGLIYINGNTLRFDGANNVAADGSLAFVVGAVTTSHPLPFGDGSNKNIYSEAKAVIAAQTDGNNTQIKIKLSLYNLQQYIKDQVTANEPKGTIKELYDLDGTLLANFSTSGLGITPKWIGWAIDNGNNGTPGSVGMTTIAAGTYTDPSDGEQIIYHQGDLVGERKHVLSPLETATPVGTVSGLDGPHRKPADGSGANEYYVSGGLVAPAMAQEGHNIMQPSQVVYRVVKIV